MKINDFKLRILCLALSGWLLVSCGGSSNGGPPPPSGSDTFTYVSNGNASSITAYKLNSNTGALAPLSGSPFAGVDLPTGLALAPNSNFLAAGNANNPSVSVFRVDTDNGSIKPVAGSPFPASGGGYPLQTRFHPSGKFLYAGMQVCSTSNVWAFSVDSSNGALSPVPGAPFPGQPSIGGGGVNSIALDPGGSFLYASGSFQGITGYSVDRTSGALTQLPGSPFIPAGMFFNSKLVVHPSGNYLYMADLDADGVRVFPIMADGSLGSEITESPFASGAAPRGIALDPSGKFAFVPNEDDLSVTAFSVNSSTGALTLVGNAGTGNSPSAVTLDSSGKFLHVTNFRDGNVSTYKVNATTGALTPIAGSPFPAEDGPNSVVTTR